ncbi:MULTISPECIES: hypothetical protein [unclassified Microbacterium]|uniref:hypothetical protein n=1 Tax=unclassified Microbacterium TaxID=2609290 RepID=UPI00301AEF37
MSTITIYGASDDLLEVEGAFSEEFQAYGETRLRVLAPDGDSLIVIGEFSARDGEADWTLRVMNSATWPAWPIRFGDRPDREGDPAIIIDVPEGTIVEEMSR